MNRQSSSKDKNVKESTIINCFIITTFLFVQARSDWGIGI